MGALSMAAHEMTYVEQVGTLAAPGVTYEVTDTGQVGAFAAPAVCDVAPAGTLAAPGVTFVEQIDTPAVPAMSCAAPAVCDVTPAGTLVEAEAEVERRWLSGLESFLAQQQESVGATPKVTVRAKRKMRKARVAPAVSHAAPAETLAAPAGTSATPALSMAEPGVMTVAGSAAPAGTLATPAETLAAPALSMSVPEATYIEQVGTLAAPAVSIAAPAGTLEAPGATDVDEGGTHLAPAARDLLLHSVELIVRTSLEHVSGAVLTLGGRLAELETQLTDMNTEFNCRLLVFEAAMFENT